MKHPVTFVVRAVLIGLLLALVVLILRPDLLTDLRPVVEIRESAGGPSGGSGSGPVSYADAVAAAAPAVVNVYTTKQVARSGRALLSEQLWQPFFAHRRKNDGGAGINSLGSGVLVSSSGHILTNFHVVEGADTISIALTDGRVATAQLVGVDRESDLAVLRVGLQDLPSITLGRSEGLRVGDVVMAIGNPFNVGQTVTLGIVSATGRSELGINTFENFIQTDAAINLGNSGGALINAYGQLVGINTARFSRGDNSQGIGFAIPIRLAKGVMEQIIEHGKVIRGWLGIDTRNLAREPRERVKFTRPEHAPGALVAEVFADGPAAAAGLMSGDVITHIDGQAITGKHQLLNREAALHPGQRVPVRAVRDGVAFTTEVQVAQRPR